MTLIRQASMSALCLTTLLLPNCVGWFAEPHPVRNIIGFTFFFTYKTYEYQTTVV